MFLLKAKFDYSTWYLRELGRRDIGAHDGVAQATMDVKQFSTVEEAYKWLDENKSKFHDAERWDFDNAYVVDAKDVSTPIKRPEKSYVIAISYDFTTGRSWYYVANSLSGEDRLAGVCSANSPSALSFKSEQEAKDFMNDPVNILKFIRHVDVFNKDEYKILDKEAVRDVELGRSLASVTCPAVVNSPTYKMASTVRQFVVLAYHVAAAGWFYLCKCASPSGEYGGDRLNNPTWPCVVFNTEEAAIKFMQDSFDDVAKAGFGALTHEKNTIDYKIVDKEVAAKSKETALLSTAISVVKRKEDKFVIMLWHGAQSEWYFVTSRLNGERWWYNGASDLKRYDPVTFNSVEEAKKWINDANNRNAFFLPNGSWKFSSPEHKGYVVVNVNDVAGKSAGNETLLAYGINKIELNEEVKVNTTIKDVSAKKYIVLGEFNGVLRLTLAKHNRLITHSVDVNNDHLVFRSAEAASTAYKNSAPCGFSEGHIVIELTPDMKDIDGILELIKNNKVTIVIDNSTPVLKAEKVELKPVTKLYVLVGKSKTRGVYTYLETSCSLVWSEHLASRATKYKSPEAALEHFRNCDHNGYGDAVVLEYKDDMPDTTDHTKFNEYVVQNKISVVSATQYVIMSYGAQCSDTMYFLHRHGTTNVVAGAIKFSSVEEARKATLTEEEQEDDGIDWERAIIVKVDDVIDLTNQGYSRETTYNKLKPTADKYTVEVKVTAEVKQEVKVEEKKEEYVIQCSYSSVTAYYYLSEEVGSGNWNLRFNTGDKSNSIRKFSSVEEAKKWLLDNRLAIYKKSGTHWRWETLQIVPVSVANTNTRATKVDDKYSAGMVDDMTLKFVVLKRGKSSWHYVYNIDAPNNAGGCCSNPVSATKFDSVDAARDAIQSHIIEMRLNSYDFNKVVIIPSYLAVDSSLITDASVTALTVSDSSHIIASPREKYIVAGGVPSSDLCYYITAEVRREYSALYGAKFNTVVDAKKFVETNKQTIAAEFDMEKLYVLPVSRILAINGSNDAKASISSLKFSPIYTKKDLEMFVFLYNDGKFSTSKDISKNDKTDDISKAYRASATEMGNWSAASAGYILPVSAYELLSKSVAEKKTIKPVTNKFEDGDVVYALDPDFDIDSWDGDADEVVIIEGKVVKVGSDLVIVYMHADNGVVLCEGEAGVHDFDSYHDYWNEESGKGNWYKSKDGIKTQLTAKLQEKLKSIASMTF